MSREKLNEATLSKARSLRKNMTDAEVILWKVLRRQQLDGHRFRRQHPIGSYIVDFACTEQKLIVELDGSQHQEQIEYDQQRTAFLRSLGWRVLRYWNNDVMQNLEGVRSDIAAAMNPSPPPSPPPARGRG